MSMFRNRIGMWVGIAALACLLVPAAALAQEEGHKIVIKKVVKECEDGGECETEDHQVRRVFVTTDGEHHEISGDGYTWVSDGDGEHVGHHAVIERFGGGSFLGVALTELSPELRSHFGVPDDAGVMVSKVIDDSPAFRAGLEVGDIVTSVDGEAVASGQALAHSIRARESGETVTLEVWRDGQVQTLSAAVEERKAEELHKAHRAIFIGCEDGDEECEVHADVDHDVNFTFNHEFDSSSELCEGVEECEVTVECDDGECSCVVNGEAVECKALSLGDDEMHGVHQMRKIRTEAHKE